jgi:hypothetical protein
MSEIQAQRILRASPMDAPIRDGSRRKTAKIPKLEDKSEGYRSDLGIDGKNLFFSAAGL